MIRRFRRMMIQSQKKQKLYAKIYSWEEEVVLKPKDRKIWAKMVMSKQFFFLK